MYFRRKPFTAEISAGQHVCLLYSSEKRRIIVLKQSIKKAIQMKEKVLCTGSDNPLISRSLFSPGDILIQDCLASGQLEVCDLTRRDYLIERIPMFLKRATEKALSDGWSGLFFALDIRNLLQLTIDPLKITKMEARLSQVIKRSRCRGLCQYNYRTLAASLILNALATHPFVAIGEIAFENPYYLLPPPFLGQDSPALVLDKLLVQLSEDMETMHIGILNSL